MKPKKISYNISEKIHYSLICKICIICECIEVILFHFKRSKRGMNQGYIIYLYFFVHYVCNKNITCNLQKKNERRKSSILLGTFWRRNQRIHGCQKNLKGTNAIIYLRNMRLTFNILSHSRKMQRGIVCKGQKNN
ncbi:hypothetical protein AK88_04691 [Plasmodium fragile]|uniref:Uncharacterized protein n=1 Tax=Plasmodium fragile TaxID=5857 RepID=A0A0D9QF54_PLAFR|nr:uncharacterized protein AK88_04691 [Plasmodium fragile]KJP85660.1 hypothetical protein AK88_04691 [Plasmodium fragile]